MSVTIPLDPRVESRLRERAETVGEDLTDYLTKLVDHFGALPTPLETLSGPVADRFRASGDTEQQLIDEIECAKHALRADRQTPGATG